MSCLKLLIIKLLIEKLNISIENWCCYLKIAILIHSGTTGDSNCPSFVPCLVSYGAFKCFPGMAQNVTQQSGKCVMTALLKTVEYRCSVCHKSCRTVCGLVLREGLHRGVYPYTCPFCGHGFSGNSNFRGHLVVHTGVNEFTCNICKRAFRLCKIYNTVIHHKMCHP